MKNKRKTTEEFIKEAKAIHGEKYDYSNTVYVSSKEKVEVKCNTCGRIFYIRPNNHLSLKQGCPSCGNQQRHTNEDFIEMAKKRHGNKYDYSEVHYVNNKEKVKIKCNTCGNSFMMMPINHLMGKQGCPYCNGTHRKTTEQFIEEARKVHGDKYDYSLVDYKNAQTKVKIICPIHGEFEQSPHKHLIGHGCRKCSNREAITFEEFVKRALKVHGKKYEYHEDKYNGFTNSTIITCPIHGDFIQVPQLHLLGCGCQKCGIEKRNVKRKISFDEFLERANKVHDNKYEYVKETYQAFSKPLKIICPQHGEFWQVAYKHVAEKHGCPKCAREKQTDRQLVGMEEFVNRSRAVHGDKYDYSKVVYKGNDKKVIITCPIHGDFEQTPMKHWFGNGCPKCNQSHLEREVEKMLNEGKIEHIYQATKKDLQFLEMKSLDFYIPSKNIAIECQGIQHFENVAFLKSEAVQKRDKDKFKECIDNGVNVVYFMEDGINPLQYEYYKDKKCFNKIIDLQNFLKNETTN